MSRGAALPALLLSSVGGWCTLSLVLLLTAGTRVSLELGLSLHPLTLVQHGAVLLKAAIVSSSWVCAYVAVKHLPITIAGPLRAVSPALTVLGALVLFREAPSTSQWLGMIVMFAGYWFLSRTGQKEGISFTTSKWVGLLVLGTAIGAMSGLYDKYLLQTALLPATTLQFWFASYAVVLQTGLILAMRVQAPVEETSFQFSWTAPLTGALLVLADQFYFRALSDPESLVSVVALVRRSSALVSFALGSMVFREIHVASKARALGVVMIGLLILLLAR